MKELSLYLASASPRRLELLRRIGLDPHLLRHSVDESGTPGESPREHAQRLAQAKCRDAAARLDPGGGALRRLRYPRVAPPRGALSRHRVCHRQEGRIPLGL